MLSLDPESRPSMAEVLSDSWFTDESMATPEEVREEIISKYEEKEQKIVKSDDSDYSLLPEYLAFPEYNTCILTTLSIESVAVKLRKEIARLDGSLIEKDNTFLVKLSPGSSF